MLCKNEAGGDPGRCLKEGRRVTRCATDLQVVYRTRRMNIGLICARRINKMRENCLEQFEAHWNCLELNNQACPLPLFSTQPSC